VSLAALALLQVCINICPGVLESNLEKLMPLLFLKLCAGKQSVRSAAEAALQGEGSRALFWPIVGVCSCRPPSLTLTRCTCACVGTLSNIHEQTLALRPTRSSAVLATQLTRLALVCLC
jgi:hypothetical protein